MSHVAVSWPGENSAEIALDVPARGNALSSILVDQLVRALETAVAANAAVVALTSTSSVFCSGFDLRESDSSDGELAARFTQIDALLEQLRHLPAVTVACVDGAAYGAGADLVAACDYRLGTSRAAFRFPGSRFGVVLGLQRLTAVVGADQARDLVLRARVINAWEAQASGLIDLMEATEMSEFVAELAEELSALDAPTVEMILQVTRHVSPLSDAELILQSAGRPGLADRIALFAARRRAPAPS